jgi:hypothetical protein
MLCKFCGEEEAVTLKVNTDDPSYDVPEVIGWPETQQLLEDFNTGDGDGEAYYTLEAWCSTYCLHADGEMAHAMAED